MTGESKMTHSRKLVEKQGEMRRECGRDERLQESGTSPAASRLFCRLSTQYEAGEQSKTMNLVKVKHLNVCACHRKIR